MHEKFHTLIVMSIAALMMAIVTAALIIGAPTHAKAADLSMAPANAVGDLEERIAELESTVARKGNHKVRLTISGWVAEQLTWWDDGTESNFYVGGLGQTLATHVKFSGEALINPDVSAGYVLHIEANTNDALAANQDSDDADAGLVVRQSYWFLKSKALGKVSVGRQSSASDNAAMLVDGSGSMVPANWVLFDNAGFYLRSNGNFLFKPAFLGGGRATWGGELGYCTHMGSPTGADCNGAPTDSVRYDSPTFAGFSVSAAWGEDDFWDAALRYGGEFSGFRLAAAAAYSSNSEVRIGVAPMTNLDATYYQVGGYVEHIASGVFLYGAYGKETNSFDFAFAPPGAISAPDGSHWYAKAGLRERWLKLGHTIVYGEYASYDDMFGPTANFIDNILPAHDVETNITLMGAGVVQEIDAAAMSVWLKYRLYQGEAKADSVGEIPIDDWQAVTFGALINF